MLLEREGQLVVLEEFVARLGTDGGKVVFIRGEAGVGKSALVKESTKSHVDDLLIPQPLGPFWDMARVESSLREPVGDGDRPRVLEAVLELLSRSLRPTIVIIEDTQWADEATLDSIKYLGRRIAETNGLLILTYRDGEVDYDHPLRGVIGDIPAQNVARIHLGGRPVSAVSLIVGDSNLDPHQVLEATDGNAFLVTEMASAPGDTVPSSLQDSVMAKVRHLSAGAREMLKTLAVIPEPIPRLDALTLAGADEARLEECERRGLLDTESELVAFRHDLTRRAVEGTLSASERLARNRIVSIAFSRKLTLLFSFTARSKRTTSIDSSNLLPSRLDTLQRRGATSKLSRTSAR